MLNSSIKASFCLQQQSSNRVQPASWHSIRKAALHSHTTEEPSSLFNHNEGPQEAVWNSKRIAPPSNADSAYLYSSLLR